MARLHEKCGEVLHRAIELGLSTLSLCIKPLLCSGTALQVSLAVPVQIVETERLTGAYELTQMSAVPFGRYMGASRHELFMLDADPPPSTGPWPEYFYVSRRRHDGISWREVERIDVPEFPAGNPLLFRRFDATADTLVCADEGLVASTGGGVIGVYDLSLNVSQLRRVLTSDIPQVNGRFGNAVAIDGDLLVVAEPFTTRGGTNQSPGFTWTGAVHLFERGPSGDWGNRLVLTPEGLTCSPNYHIYSQFGRSVAVHNEVIVVGCLAVFDSSFPTFPPGASPRFGCAIVYERVAGAWRNTACLRVPANVFSGFGCWSVAVRGDRIVAADIREGVSSPLGRLYVFERSAPGPGNWVFRDEIRASDGAVNPSGYPTDSFGWVLDLDDDEILVGAPFATPDGDPAYYSRGSAYRFRQVGGQWVEERLWTTGTTAQAAGSIDRELGRFVAFVEGGVVVSASIGIGATPGVPSGVVCYYQDPIARSVCDGAANSAHFDGARLDVRGAPLASTGRLGFFGRQFPRTRSRGVGGLEAPFRADDTMQWRPPRSTRRALDAAG